MEDDPNLFLKNYNDDLKKNGRRPKKKEDDLQKKRKMTSKKKEDDLQRKMEDNL